MKWKVEVTTPLCEKCIIALAPHTSNMDFIMGMLYSRAEGIKANFLMKKEWFFWPMGCMMRSLGGIPVYRSKRTSMTDQLADVANQAKSFQLCITPEGTRKRTTEWKKGFYYIALKANLPIHLYGLDFKSKLVTCTKVIIPNGDVDAQMTEIKEYFKNFSGKHPALFATGLE